MDPQGRLQGIKVLVMPSCYCLTEKEAASLDDFVQKGGVVLCEAHLGGYNATTGRHSRKIPGGNLAELWNIHEVETTSSYHLNIGEINAVDTKGLSEDTKKVLDAYGTTGGKYFPVVMKSGSVIFGAERFAEIGGSNVESWGEVDGRQCIGLKKIGKGAVVYCGSNFGEGAKYNSEGFIELVRKVCDLAGVIPNFNIFEKNIRIDPLGDDMIIINNRSKEEREISIDCKGTLKGLFSGISIEGKRPFKVKGNFADIFCKDEK